LAWLDEKRVEHSEDKGARPLVIPHVLSVLLYSLCIVDMDPFADASLDYRLPD
jgi:hypothetical protein